MRIAIISDIHGNLPALESVLDHAGSVGASTFWCLGDIVGYGPFPNECVALIREKCSIVLKGNHDSGLVGDTDVQEFNRDGLRAILWSREVVLPEHAEFLKKLPLKAMAEAVTLVHATPHNPANWDYLLTLHAAQAAFDAFTTDLCFVGHSHVPGVIPERSLRGREGERRIVNVGSVGQPRDGNPASSYVLFDPETRVVELVRVTYDIQRTAEAIHKADLPDFLAKRLFKGF
jgi:predicted phosphodiesterase